MSSSTTVTGARDVDDVRDTYRPARFRLGVHLAQTMGVAALIAASGAWLARTADAAMWLWTPVFWLVANVVEWLVHRYLMHRPLVPRTMYRNHAIWHHTSFPFEHLAITSSRDLGLVMMPWYTLVLVFTVASPIVVVTWLWQGPDLAGVFLVAAVAYFLVYELLHTLYHLDRSRWRAMPTFVAKLFKRLADHHAEHHRLERMRRINFNVTVPLADWLFRTYAVPGSDQSSDKVQR